MINDYQQFNESKSYRIPKKNLDLNFGMDGNVLVIENPTVELFNALYDVAKELRGLATLDDIYFWKADEATHDSMRVYIIKVLGCLLMVINILTEIILLILLNNMLNRFC